MSFVPKTREEKILCRVETTARTGFEKALEIFVNDVYGKFEDVNDNIELVMQVVAVSQPLIVPFTVTEEGGEASASTTADFAEVAAAVMLERPVRAKMRMRDGAVVVFGELTSAAPAVNPSRLEFVAEADLSAGTGTPEPKVITLTFTADGAEIAMRPAT